MQQTSLARAKRYRVAALAMLSAFALVACSSDDASDNAEVCNVNVTIPINTNTLPEVVGEPFSFPNGAAFSTGLGNNPVTLTFTTVSTFTLTSGTSTASGNAAFGSCRLTVTASTFPAGRGPQVGDNLNFPICNFVITANNVAVGGGAVSGTAVALFVNAADVAATTEQGPVQVRIQDNGLLVIDTVVTDIDINAPGVTCQ